ncbi:MAG: hypothetical protein D3904_11025 [Candidatus Electrothrix sp. EH2]|nr:hypothetical protein [Candidatus Electrothrix sp. EH2]
MKLSTNLSFFFTICTHERKCLFGEITDGKMRLNDARRIVTEEWLKTPVIRAEIELDEWVVMPNHFHGIAVITDAGATNRHGAKKRYTDDRPVGRSSGRSNGRPPVALSVPTCPPPICSNFSRHGLRQRRQLFLGQECW